MEKIIIEVRSGCVIAIYAKEPKEVWILDWDEYNCTTDEGTREDYRELEQLSKNMIRSV